MMFQIIILFIDACRGTLEPRARGDDLLPENMMVAYSTREDDQGGIWMQKIAVKLRENKEINVIVAEVNKIMKR